MIATWIIIGCATGIALFLAWVLCCCAADNDRAIGGEDGR